VADRTWLLLLAGYLAVLGLGAYEFRHAPSLSEPPAPPELAAPALPPLEVPPGPIRSLAAYDAIVERPLFSPDRRPETEQPAEQQTESADPEEPATEVDGFRLTAVLRDGDNTTVLIEDRGGKTLTLHQGDRLGGWQLGEILDDRVELVADGRRETLMVYDFAAPAQAPASDNRARRAYRRIRPPAAARPAPAERRLSNNPE
jgi:general secretion pathway protein N